MPGEALTLVASLEICWGSIPTKRPNRNHKFGSCHYVSNKVIFEGNGCLEVSSQKDRNTVLEMFSRHFNYHPLIPDRNGILRSSNTIHCEFATEMYTCCRKKIFRLWAYKFVNWYRMDQWKLWARSYHPEEIPVLKTTMIVESHWRCLKHDFLHRFSRPRIDMVIWIMTSRSIPQALDRTTAIQICDKRRAIASWRKSFTQA